MWLRAMRTLCLLLIVLAGAESRKERHSDLKQSRQEELEQTLSKIRDRHGAADGNLDAAQLPPAVSKMHASLTAELTAIEANRVVKSMEKLYTHATTGDVPQPTRRRAARGEGGDGKWRREIGRLSRDVKKEKLEDLEEEEMEDRYSKVPEPSWSKRNRRKRGKTAAARREAAAVSDL
mmetsp:Transcript_12770/g.26843  ORF Transcript_12770/g.26843 Transcript_12770/m.26843 type:complete len:178 (+) Transcript_12770:135-668(+)